MKTYISPNTEYYVMRLVESVLLESGEGSKTNPTEVNEGQSLAPRRLYI